jgi:hypothetical protein
MTLRSWSRAQFIAHNGGDREFWGGRAAAGDEEEGGAVNMCLEAWRLLRRATESEGKARWCGGKREPRGAWPEDGGRRRVNPLSRKEGESHGDVTGVTSSSQSARGFYRTTLSTHPEHESNSGGVNHGEGRRRWDSSVAADLIWLATVPWGDSLQSI